MKRPIVGACAALVCACVVLAKSFVGVPVVATSVVATSVAGGAMFATPALATPVLATQPPATVGNRSLPMTFALQVEGPPERCGGDCRTWVSAFGAITADTAADFKAFADRHDIRGATLVLDSDGGSVLGALAFGRLVRGLGMTTTVGRSESLGVDSMGQRRARIDPQATCESMCSFVLLGGVERHVPAQARVKVHQIWLGDRREDPIAASYSAQDLVLVQRDIGRLAQYTIEMGVTIDLLEMALRIPPWEPMRELTRAELRQMRIVTGSEEIVAAPHVATSGSRVMSSGPRAAVGDQASWVMADRPDGAVLTRRHPLTVEGDAIGSFELYLSCGGPGRDYALTYVEQRRRSGGGQPATPTGINVALSGQWLTLKVTSSQAVERGPGLDTVASAQVPDALVRKFAGGDSRSLTVETTSPDTMTEIRVGNAGIAHSFSAFASTCGTVPTAQRAGLRREAAAQPAR